MWPPVTPVGWAVWLCAVLPVVYADSVTLYKKVGDDVVLKPANVPEKGAIISILWKDGPNIAIQWDGTDTDSYRHFIERGGLNPSNGEMTITGLTRNDSGLYSAEINDIKSPAIHLQVISPVPKPDVGRSCDDEATRCTLTCDGDTTHAEPVTYRWKSGDNVTGSSKEQHITKEDSSGRKEFSCELVNPVSRESSQAVPNPLVTAPPVKLNISTGLTVFIALLMSVLLLVTVHRCKAGKWFFQKTSMPWEADFWRRHEREPRDAVEANGSFSREETNGRGNADDIGSQTPLSREGKQDDLQ